MVRIINYNERKSDDGKVFFTLDIQGGIEMVQSVNTGKFYATAHKSSITTTFDEATCKALVGTELPGTVTKQECEPYEYTIKDTGEVITLTHRYEFVPGDNTSNAPQSNLKSNQNKPITASSEVFSENGILEPTM